VLRRDLDQLLAEAEVAVNELRLGWYMRRDRVASGGCARLPRARSCWSPSPAGSSPRPATAWPAPPRAGRRWPGVGPPSRVALVHNYVACTATVRRPLDGC